MDYTIKLTVSEFHDLLEVINKEVALSHSRGQLDKYSRYNLFSSIEKKMEDEWERVNPKGK